MTVNLPLANPLTTLPLQTILNFMEEKDTITQNEETNINADGDTLETTNSSNESIDNTIEKIQAQLNDQKDKP